MPEANHDHRTSREIRLAARPVGEPTLDTFTLVETELPTPGPGQVLVRNTWMSVDPYMRGRMNEGESYIPAFEVGRVLEGGAVGTVVASAAEIPVGTTVSHFLGWREYAVLDASAATVIDTTIAPAPAYLGPLGITGLTAYLAVTDTAPVVAGDVVFVSAAAGAVGSVAGQIARKLGASRVIGSAGGPAKSATLTNDFGFDQAIDYRAGAVADQLAKAAPDGIDVYIDNVGGDHLEAAIANMRVGGRIAAVGAISGYNAVEPEPGPRNLYQLVTKRLTMRGLLVLDHLDQFPAYIAKASRWLADDTIRTKETVLDGIEQAPAAFLGVLQGLNTGKMLVRLTSE